MIFYEINIILRNGEEWSDSFWTDKEDAVREARKIFDDSYGDDNFDQVSVICRAVNIAGNHEKDLHEKVIVTYR